jgi:ABC-2 type transport system permease protein
MTIPVIPNLVSSVLMIVTVGTDPLHSAFLILIPQAAGVFSALLGILINAVFPKLEFENEAQVVKQSMATVITMLATTLFGLINLAIAFVFSVILESSLLAMTVMLLVSIAFSVAAFFVITKPLSKKIEKMSV